MDVLAVIPARGGSTGMPGKNLALLAGRPLLAYTCDAVRTSARVTRAAVSTDSEEIAAAARALGVAAPFLRPADLATDDTTMLDVVRHALDELGDPDAVVLLQPTSPLRRGAHVDEAIELWAETGADSVVSVVPVPHAFSPPSLLRLVAGRLVPYEDGERPTRRQDKPTVYARNGPAVLVTRPATVRAGSLYGDDVRPYVMAPEDSIDIDDRFDLELAELLLVRRGRTRAPC